jgi:hypothetical protein
VTKKNGFTLDPPFLQTFDPPTNSGKIFHVTADTFVPSLLSNELESIDALLKQSGKSVPKTMRYQVLGGKDTRPDVSAVWKSKNARQCAQCEKISTKDLMLCSRGVVFRSIAHCSSLTLLFRCRLTHYCSREWCVTVSILSDSTQQHWPLSQTLAWPSHKVFCKKVPKA